MTATATLPAPATAGDLPRRRKEAADKLKAARKVLAKTEVTPPEQPPEGPTLAELVDEGITLWGLWSMLSDLREERGQFKARPDPRFQAADKARAQIVEAEAFLRETASPAIRHQMDRARAEVGQMQNRIAHWAPVVEAADEAARIQEALPRWERWEITEADWREFFRWTGRPLEILRQITSDRRGLAELPTGATNLAEGRRAKNEALRQKLARELVEWAHKRLGQLRARAELHDKARTETAEAEARIVELEQQIRELRNQQLEP